MKKDNLLLALYFILGIAELISHFFNLSALHFICKPLLLIVLLLYFSVSIKGVQTKTTGFIQIALVFSWVGDVLLMFVEFNKLYFIGGLLAFLICHILYILAFSKSVEGQESYIKKRPLSTLPFIIIGTFLYYSLYPNLDELKVPVLLYTSVIILMVIFSLNRIENVSMKSFRLVYYGAIIFMISDAVLAINKFLSPIENADIMIMATYILAQFLIVEGIISQAKQKLN